MPKFSGRMGSADFPRRRQQLFSWNLCNLSLIAIQRRAQGSRADIPSTCMCMSVRVGVVSAIIIEGCCIYSLRPRILGGLICDVPPSVQAGELRAEVDSLSSARPSGLMPFRCFVPRISSDNGVIISRRQTLDRFPLPTNDSRRLCL